MRCGMKNLGLHEIRKEFLSFFEKKGHKVLPSFSLIPKNDKSLLLIGAGMAPMKKFFTGEATPPGKRVTTCQKCIRTGDIDNVGKTDRHATFFEMLGNFSFGDYFKKEVIPWAYEFLTVNLEINKDDLWVTVYKDDDEAFNIWKNDIGIAEDRIIRLGKEDNFWELEVGPSGPCTEIYVDRGLKYGSIDERPGGEGDRFIEVWNLVFTQFDKDEKGNYTPLSHPNIDTGMGLERIATVLQGTNNIFEIDAITEIINEIEKISDYKYGTDKKLDVSTRVITDHIRAITFLVGDTVRPSNEGRGYVLRRLIRRAARHGRLLGIKKTFLYELCDFIIKSWGENYKELVENSQRIKDVIKGEEEKFQMTIESGTTILDSYIEKLKSSHEKILSGEDSFKLYDTYGFPPDLTKEILTEKGFEMDMDGFNDYMDKQKKRARNAHKDTNIGWDSHTDESVFTKFKNEFVGYEEDKCQANIIGIFKDYNEVQNIGPEEKAVLILDKTPFYGEGGGQVGDTGYIDGDDFKCRVIDTKKTREGLHLHIVEVLDGEVTKGPCFAEIDVVRRNNIRRNHSVTHLLHKALKEILGDHVNQAGSLVEADRLRFDFTHYQAMSQEEIKKVEDRVNQKIFEALSVTTTVTNPKHAQELGAVGLFEEKYGDIVRVLSMGDYSIELCGGTHVRNTSEISMFKILSESGVSSGVRRIEGVTGPAVYKMLNDTLNLRDEIAHELKANKTDILQKLSSSLNEIKKLNKAIDSLKHSSDKDELSNILDEVKEKNGINYLTHKFKDKDVNSLRDIADMVRNKLNSVVVLLATENDGKLNFVCALSKDLVSNGYSAGKIIKEVSKVCGGGGGGRADMATAGGRDLGKVSEALKTLEGLI